MVVGANDRSLLLRWDVLCQKSPNLKSGNSQKALKIFYKTPALPNPKIIPAPRICPKLAVASNSGMPKLVNTPGKGIGKLGP